MRRAAVVLFLIGCGGGAAARGPDSSVAVAPKPVAATPLEVVGEGPATSGADVPPFEIAIGQDFCVRIEGRVHCGRAEEGTALAAAPPVGGIDDATSIAASSGVACLTTRRGTVHCWGANTNGQLGAGLRDDFSKDPVQVIGIANARRVFVSDDHACATTRDRTLVCWGLNRGGETGGPTSWAPAARELAVATVVPGILDVVTVALSSRATCALTKPGDVWCWGYSITSAQQNKQGYNNEQPFRIAPLAKSEDLSGEGGAYCTVSRGDAYCLGSTYSLLPSNTAQAHDHDTAVKIELGRATKVRVAGSHACALMRDGRVWCWGQDSSGELGRGGGPYDPTQPHSYEPKAPAEVPGLMNARDIVVGRASTCAVTGPQEAQCWGMFPSGGHGGAPRIERSPVRLRIR